jgi:hypothetical protein
MNRFDILPGMNEGGGAVGFTGSEPKDVARCESKLII